MLILRRDPQRAVLGSPVADRRDRNSLEDLPRDVAAQVFSVQVFPLLAGMSLRQWCSDWADRWNPVIQKAASVLLLVLLAVVLIATLPKVSLTLVADLRGAFVMLLLTLIALLLGYAVASEDRAERSTIPLVIAMRNPGLALLLVQQMAPEASELKAAIVGYVVMTAIGMTPSSAGARAWSIQPLTSAHESQPTKKG